MSKWSDDPAFRLSKYIEESLRDAAIIPAKSAYVTDTDTQDDYELAFMMSAAQQPEVLTQWNSTTGTFSSLPFCVYTMKDNESDLWEYSGLATYTFYYDGVDKLVEIKNFLRDLLNRQDYTATDINYYFRNDPTYPFDFKNIRIQVSAGPQPPGEEDGRSSYLLSIYWCATYEGINRAEDYGAQTGQGRI